MNNKFTKRPNEKNYEFVTRIMKGSTILNERLNAKQVHARVDRRGAGRNMTWMQVQSSLYYASKKTGKIVIHKDSFPIEYSYNDTLSHSDQHALLDDSKFFDENLVDFYTPPQHKKDAVKDFDPELFVKKMTRDGKFLAEPRDALVSTVKHEFTAEQLLESLEALNQDLHDNVIVAIFAALGKDTYSPMHHDYPSWSTKAEPRKTALMDWHFEHGNLVVKE